MFFSCFSALCGCASDCPSIELSWAEAKQVPRGEGLELASTMATNQPTLPLAREEVADRKERKKEKVGFIGTAIHV